MAKPTYNKKKAAPETVNYREAVAALKSEGPKRLYLLFGQEDYLREQFLSQLKAICLLDGEDDFSFRRFDGAELDLNAFADAVDALPFLSERTFVEIRGFDTNKVAEAAQERFIALLSDIPDYCTVAFVMPQDFAPDGRLRVTKALKKHGALMQFAPQEDASLVKWISRRFAAARKRITIEDARYLIQITGGLMNRMIPEIDKISAYARGEIVTREDIDAVTQKIPDAVIYEMTDCIAQGDRDGALSKLAEPMSAKENVPTRLLAGVSRQIIALHAAKIAGEHRLPLSETMELCDVRYEFQAQKLLRSARRFSEAALQRAVVRCAETEFAMKHTGMDDVALLEDLLLAVLVEAGA